LNLEATPLLPSVRYQVENPRGAFARNAGCFHFALTVLFQAGGIGLNRRSARMTQRMTSPCQLFIIDIYL